MTNELSERDPSEFDVGDDRRDQLFDVLSHPYRRFVLDNLLSVEMPVPVRELSADLAEWETSASDRSGEKRSTIEISLVHNHLPKMAEAEFIEYDAERQTVVLANRSDEVRPHLHAMRTDVGGD